MSDYYFRDANGNGSAPLEDIQSAVKNGGLTPEVMVSRDGKNWTAIADAGEVEIMPPAQVVRAQAVPYHPHPSPPQGPHTVVVKSGCGKSVLILCVILGTIALLIGGCVVFGVGAGMNAVEKVQKEKEAAASQIELTDYSWNKEAGGGVLVVGFTLHNKGPRTVKDFTVRCDHYAESGTKIDSNSRIVYAALAPGESKSFTEQNMGFIRSQVDSSSAVVEKADFAK
jgi:hypothetical protein